MVWWAAAAVTTAVSLAGSYSAKKAAKTAGKYSSRNIMAETTEALRRNKAQFEQLEGSSLAGLGGAGIRKAVGGTADSYLGAMRDEFDLQQAWTLKSGQMRARAARKGAGAAADAFQNQAIGSIAQAWGSSFTTKWWNEQPPTTTEVS